MKLGYALSTGLLASLIGCGDPLPDDVEGYAARCIRMNPTPIAPRSSDPHRGFKNVYACNVALGVLRENARPFPEGALIVKESTREGEQAPWLVATARKERAGWTWAEYTRNFSDESFRRNLAGQSVCTDCHGRARDVDWIFTEFSSP